MEMAIIKITPHPTLPRNDGRQGWWWGGGGGWVREREGTVYEWWWAVRVCVCVCVCVCVRVHVCVHDVQYDSTCYC